MILFVTLKVLSTLVFPPASLAVAVLLWLILRLRHWRRPAGRIAGIILYLGIAQTLILSLGPISDALMGPLEEQASEAARNSPRCCFDAIVILGGAISPASQAGGRPTLTEASDRIWAGAALWHNKVAPRIILSGGSVSKERGESSVSEAEAMRVFLIALGVPKEAIVLEGHSINTIENMHEVHRLVGDGRVALVTSAYHMPRALSIAKREGLAVSAFPANFRAGNGGSEFVWDNWLPSVGALAASILALRERIALTLDWRSAGETR